MLTFVIGALVVILTFVVGGLFAFLTARMDTTITKTNANIAAEEKAVRPAVTMGYEISTDADANEQIRQARKLAAKQAAAMPRGANVRIGNKDTASDKLASASKGVEEDPWTAAKIAKFHGWVGAKTGIPAGGAAAVAAAPVAAAPAAGGKIKLVPGKDYPYIEITDDMPPDEKRKARIANSKAKSAAMKAAKAAGVTAAPVAAATAVAAPVAAAAPIAVDVEAPVLIPMTDDMSPDEKRKARIANSKAKSKFNKALKAVGVDPKTVKFDDDGKVIWPQGAPPTTTAAAPATAAPVAAAPAASSGPLDLAALGIDPPDITPMTDDMSPDEKRKARINNSKAKSAFNKALKGAGVDPKSVEIDDNGNVSFKAGAAPAAAQPAAVASAPAPAAAPAGPASTVDGSVDLAAWGIDPPELTELSDDMSPDEKRAARMANSKANSAFNKALMAAGVDPQSVKL